MRELLDPTSLNSTFSRATSSSVKQREEGKNSVGSDILELGSFLFDIHCVSVFLLFVPSLVPPTRPPAKPAKSP